MSDQPPRSIHDFIKETDDQDLFVAWHDMLRSSPIPEMMRMKVDIDWWFQKCYQERKHLKELMQDTSEHKARMKAEELLDELKDSGSLDPFVERTLRTKDAVTWVDEAIKCVEEENKLMVMSQLVKENSPNVAAREMRRKLQEMVDCANEEFQMVHTKNKDLKNLRNKLTDLQQAQREMKERLTECDTAIAEAREMDNGLIMNLDKLESNRLMYVKQHDRQAEIDSTHRRIGQLENELHDLFAQLVPNLETVRNSLCEEVRKWQDDFKHWYVEIGKDPFPIDNLAHWCGQLGKILKDACDDASEFVSSTDRLQKMLNDFISRTFIVTEQDGYIVKKGKKFPEFTVRVLASANIIQELEIETLFLLEEDINCCFHGDRLNIQQLKKKNVGLKNAVQTFKASAMRKESPCEVKFKGLQFNNKSFSRPNTKKAVHEQKYRMVFIPSHCYFSPILSLPLVVTTGGNQNSAALASTMWQCFSTDVYALPILPLPDLPWKSVAEMLQKKMLKLCPSRPLTPDNLTHLKRRLLCDENLSDDSLVTFKEFSEDPLCNTLKDEKCSFSFWSWFLANYNLLEQFLLHYWKDGLIGGYMSKDDAEKKLLACNDLQSGLFLLRFSDNNIVESQGVTTVYGFLVVSVQVITGEKEKKSKIEYLKLDDLTKEGNILANQLKKEKIQLKKENMQRQHLFQYVCPGYKSREDTFDKYCEDVNIMDGYVTVDKFITDLEQMQERLNICKRKRQSSFGDSDCKREEANNKTTKRCRTSIEQCQTGNILAKKASPVQCSDRSPDVSSSTSPCQPASLTDASSKFTNMHISSVNGMNKTSVVSPEPSQQPVPGIPTVVPTNVETGFGPGTLAKTTFQVQAANVGAGLSIVLNEGISLQLQTVSSGNEVGINVTTPMMPPLTQATAPMFAVIDTTDYSNAGNRDMDSNLNGCHGNGISSGCNSPLPYLRDEDVVEAMDSGSIDVELLEKSIMQ